MRVLAPTSSTVRWLFPGDGVYTPCRRRARRDDARAELAERVRVQVADGADRLDAGERPEAIQEAPRADGSTRHDRSRVSTPLARYTGVRPADSTLRLLAAGH